MTDKTEIKKNLDILFPKEELANNVEEINGCLCINGICPLPIKTPHYYKKDNPVNIKNEVGSIIGTIYFLKGNKVQINSIPEFDYCCFLYEYPGQTIAENDYTFSNDYIIIKKDNIIEYLSKYKNTSSIWGGFFHKENLSNNNFSKLIAQTELTAVSRILIDRPFYLESLELILNEHNPFNRFLKLYHLIEMQFDIHTAVKINELLVAGNKEKEISRTLKDYNREDIERLKSLFSIKLDIRKFTPFLDNIIRFKSIADSIFYEYGKDSNPIKSKKDFDALVSLGSFNKNNIDKQLGNSSFEHIIPKIISYWIYRIRSSIAHNKLGEYLMTVNDEEFIIEFAEPLLREVIIQCYINETTN